MQDVVKAIVCDLHTKKTAVTFTKHCVGNLFHIEGFTVKVSTFKTRYSQRLKQDGVSLPSLFKRTTRESRLAGRVKLLKTVFKGKEVAEQKRVWEEITEKLTSAKHRESFSLNKLSFLHNAVRLVNSVCPLHRQHQTRNGVCRDAGEEGNSASATLRLRDSETLVKSWHLPEPPSAPSAPEGLYTQCKL